LYFIYYEVIIYYLVVFIKSPIKKAVDIGAPISLYSLQWMLLFDVWLPSSARSLDVRSPLPAGPPARTPMRLCATRPFTVFRVFVDTVAADAFDNGVAAHQQHRAAVSSGLPPQAPRLQGVKSEQALTGSAQLRRRHPTSVRPQRVGARQGRRRAAVLRPSGSPMLVLHLPASRRVRARAVVHVQEQRQRRVR
jgi:hypothetical protein